MALDFAPPSLHKFSWFCVQRKCYWPHYVDSACPSFFAVQMKWGKIQTNTQVAKERKANFCHLIQLFQRQSAYVAVTINIICVLKMIHYERSTYMHVHIDIVIYVHTYVCTHTIYWVNNKLTIQSILINALCIPGSYRHYAHIGTPLLHFRFTNKQQNTIFKHKYFLQCH